MDDLTVDDAHFGFLDNRFTCVELVAHYLERINIYNGHLPTGRRTHGSDTSLAGLATSPERDVSVTTDSDIGLNAIISISETALQEAEELDAFFAQHNTFKGSLHGIPVIIKDSIATAGLRTTYGSIKAQDHIPAEDATVVRKLKEAGAVILAKSTLPGKYLVPFSALSLTFPDWSASFHCLSSLSGITKNPHDRRRDPCSGTGAAIAADFAILGLDTDTDGNVGLPASFNSLIGLRPRPGMISRYGISPLVLPQDTPGPIGRTVKDVALTYQAMVGFDPRDSLTSYSDVIPADPEGANDTYTAGLESSDASSLRIGIVDSLFGTDDDAECRPVNDLVRIALDQVREAGAMIVPITIPHLRQWFITTSLYADRSRSDLDNFLTKYVPELGLSVRGMQGENAYHASQDLFELIATGADTRLDPAYAMRLEKHVEFRPFVMSQMRQSEVDFLAFPTCQIAAPLTEDILNKRWASADFPTNTYLAAQTVLPSISIPVGETDEGLPAGMTLVTSVYHEKQLLEAAAVVEREVRGRVRPRLQLPQ